MSKREWLTRMAENEFDLWVERIVRENMPIFSRTVQCVAGMAERENSSLSELAWSILEDPTLTAQVLKLANSMYYHPHSKRINTVSRAVMRLGFNTIKQICLTIALIETALSSRHKDKVALEVARAFHGAVQARTIAIKRGLPQPEEVFIAALLTRIGHIAFWCFAGEAGDRLDGEVLNAEGEEQAEINVLGFGLGRLTLRLSQEWKLSDLLESALQDKSGTDPRVHSIKLGCAVAQASEKGWDCPQIKQIMKDAGIFLHLSDEETAKTLHESAMSAAKTVESYGAEKSSRLVPLPIEATAPLRGQVLEIEAAVVSPEAKKHSRLVPLPTEAIAPLRSQVLEIEPAAETPEAKKTSRLVPLPMDATAPFPEQDTVSTHEYPMPDPKIQMSCLRDLSTLVTLGKGDFNMALSIILEGIYRGIGMDRVIFTLLTPDRQHLKGKYGLGWVDGYVENFMVSANNSGMLNILGYLLVNRNPVWVKEKPDNNIKYLLNVELNNLTGGGPFFAMPIAIKGKAIGVIYADRSRSGRCLDEESFESFIFFGQQANMCLSALAGS